MLPNRRGRPGKSEEMKKQVKQASDRKRYQDKKQKSSDIISQSIDTSKTILHESFSFNFSCIISNTDLLYLLIFFRKSNFL